jgi:hypothetical protein
MAPEEAQAFIRKEPRNVEVLGPYLSGDDLNKSPEQSPSRWIINFHDWALEKAEKWSDLVSIVRAKVKPQRDKDRKNNYRERWWQFAERCPGLYRAIAPLKRVVVCAQTSKYLSISLVDAQTVFSNTVVVIANDKFSVYALLASAVHEAWVVERRSTLETRLRYMPTDSFETFPFPSDLSSLESIGETYHEHRRRLMLETQKGLTKIYNDFHDPECEAPGIVRLRELHVAMDIAVRDAYGWRDLELGHGWQKTEETHEKRGRKVHRVTWRYTISPEARDEILRRLLDLNQKRHDEELAREPPPSPKRKKAAAKQKPADPASPRQLDLFPNEAGP